MLIGCSTNELTGKKQLAFIPEQEMRSLSSNQYADFLKSHTVLSPLSNKNAQMVKRVGERIAASVSRYYILKGMSGQLQGYQWEYNLVVDSVVNAWCMPGGKIVVYTGILPITQTEDALAIVMGHEVSHALLQHGNQRMSSSMLQQLGGITLAVAMSQKPAETQNLFLNAYGIGTELGLMLPFSRSQELEADRYGLIWAAMAGYDVDESVRFWTRMSNVSQGQKQPEFLSTHPSDQTRIEKIKSFLPEARTFIGK